MRRLLRLHAPGLWQRRRTASVLAAALLVGGCVSFIDEDDALTAVPYRIGQGRHIIVDVSINNRGPFPFAIDTGASISVVFDSLRDRLKLAPVHGLEVIIHGAVGSDSFPLYKIARLQVGNETWREFRVASLPQREQLYADVVGVLGNDFLGRYAVGFWTDERLIRLYDPDDVSRRHYLGWGSIPLEPGGADSPGADLYFFDVRIEGHAARAIFDLGAGLNIVNWPAARKLGLTRESFSKRPEPIAGAIDIVARAPRFVAGNIYTEGVRWREEVFSIADLKIFETLALHEHPAAILGSGLFAQRDFVIDFARPRLLVNVSGEERDPVLTQEGQTIPNR